jgi:hypothetical protein
VLSHKLDQPQRTNPTVPILSIIITQTGRNQPQPHKDWFCLAVPDRNDISRYTTETSLSEHGSQPPSGMRLPDQLHFSRASSSATTLGVRLQHSTNPIDSFLRVANGNDHVFDAVAGLLLLTGLERIKHTTNEQSSHSLRIRSVAGSIMVSLQQLPESGSTGPLDALACHIALIHDPQSDYSTDV